MSIASCSSDGPSLSPVMSKGAAAIASVAIPSGWSFQSTSRSSNVTVKTVNGVALDVTTNQGKVASLGWSAVSPTITADQAAATCATINDRIEAARTAAGAQPVQPGFVVSECTIAISPDNAATTNNQGRSVVASACYPIDKTHCISASTAIEGGASDRQVLLQLSVVDKAN